MAHDARPIAPRVGIMSTIGYPLLGSLMQHLHEAGVQDYCVILDRKSFGARDQAIWTERTDGAFDDAPDAYGFGAQSIPFFAVQSHNGSDCLALVERLGLSLLVNGGTPRKIGPEMLAATPQGVLNVHPGILPQYRGASCTEWAILNDDQLGHTAHFMAEGYDDGPIIDIARYDFSDARDYRAIRIALYRKWCSMVARTVAELERSGMTAADATPQGEGIEHRPMPEEKFAEVVRKVKEGRYRPRAS